MPTIAPPVRRPMRLLALLGAVLAFGAGCAASAAPSPPADDDAARIGAGAARAPGTDYRSTALADGRTRVSTRIRSFDGETLDLTFELPAAAGRDSLREFGIHDAELESLRAACLAAPRCEQAAFDRQTTRYYREHALRLRPVAGQVSRLSVDIAEVVRRNRARVRPVAQALRAAAAARGRDADWTMRAAIALVQTGLLYRRPALSEDGRQILGFYPPPRALEQGYGDCDTKAALLAAILQNLGDTPLVGVHVRRHYLLGLAATPRAGEAAITHGGRPWVLLEAAGPAQRAPGRIADSTQAALARGEGLRIDPL
ncbi:hypothetical protein [Solimonas flava]|uniref:hypothetical protein n=1 Tax=Solimonas flava TaxID=415849 RepID=UPI0006885460|nr:hypothetical protein [Solimonas flava]